MQNRPFYKGDFLHMKAREIFKFTEKCLYNYKANLSRIGVLEEDLRVLRAGSDVHAQSYQLTFGFCGDNSDPVSRYVEKIESLENQIKRLRRNTAPITELINDMSTAKEGTKNYDYKMLIELFYFGGLLLSEIADELHKSRRTLSQRRQSLVLKAAGYLGF